MLALLDHAGVGVTHALGVGGRDLSAEVGGLATREALRRLDADAGVELIVLVSKPPAPEVEAEIKEFAASLGTPVELALLGAGHADLTEATEAVLQRLGREVPAWPVAGSAAAPSGGRWLRGLFVGGHDVERGEDHRHRAAARPRSRGHTFVDFGDDAYTTGRAHPMIDPTLRLEHLARAAADPDTAVLLLDVVLGHGAEPDPAALLAPAAVRQSASRWWSPSSARRRPAGARPPGPRRSRTPAPRSTSPTPARRAVPSSCSEAAAS